MRSVRPRWRAVFLVICAFSRRRCAVFKRWCELQLDLTWLSTVISGSRNFTVRVIRAKNTIVGPIVRHYELSYKHAIKCATECTFLPLRFRCCVRTMSHSVAFHLYKSTIRRHNKPNYTQTTNPNTETCNVRKKSK